MIRCDTRCVNHQSSLVISGWVRGSRSSEAPGRGDDERDPERPPRPDDDEDDVDWVPDFLEDMFENSNRHAVGMGLLEYVFGGSKKSEAAKKERTK